MKLLLSSVCTVWGWEGDQKADFVHLNQPYFLPHPIQDSAVTGWSACLVWRGCARQTEVIHQSRYDSLGLALAKVTLRVATEEPPFL